MTEGLSDGLLKNVDSVAAALGKIESRIKSIDSTMGSINKQSGGLAGLFQGSSKMGNGGTVGGPGKTLGSGSSITATSQATFGGAPGGPPQHPGMAGGGVFQFSQNHPKTFLAGQLGLAAGATAWNILPGVEDARSQRQAMFSATLGYGPKMPDYRAMKDQISSAFGGYATSINSQENVTAYMASFGMTMRPGANASSSNVTRFMSQTSGMSLLTGMSQEQSARAGMSIAQGRTADNLFRIGISTTNADGTPKDFGQTVKQLMKMSFKNGNPTQKDVEAGLAPGSIFRSNLHRFFGENAGVAEQYARAIAANGSTKGTLDPATMKKWGLTDPLRNPNAAEQLTTGKRSETVAEYSDDILKGWDKALEAARAVEDVMQRLSGVLGPLAAGKGFGQGMLGNTSTAALAGGVGALGGILGSSGLLMGGGALGGGAGSILGRVMKGGGGGARAGGAVVSSLGKAAARVVPAAAVVAGGGALTNGMMGLAGSEAGSSQTHKVLSTLGKILMNTATGAGAGALVGGGVPGAIFGGVAGLVGGIASAASKDDFWDYGSKANANAGGLFGALGLGEGDGASGTGQKAAEKGGTTTATGVQGAIARAKAEAQKPAQARWNRYCARFVAYTWGLPRAGYASAAAQWRAIPKQHKNPGARNAPAGALMFWTGGREGYGHVVLSLGGGMVATNDLNGPGKISIASFDQVDNWIRRRHTYVGWSQPFFGGRLVGSVVGGSGGAAVEVDGGGQATGARASSSTSGAKGMTTTSVQPWGASLISSSSYGGVSAGQYSLANMVEKSIASSMIGSGGSQTSGYSTGRQQEAGTTGGSQGSEVSGSQAANGIVTAPSKAKGVSRWEPVARSAMQAAGLNEKWLPLLMQRMQQESGGKPDAVNNWDSNAKKGYPSKGLMQVIKPTFDSFAGPYKDLGQTNPFANIYAAIKWSQHKYGEAGLQKAWSGTQGYSKGSWSISKDEITKVHQGEMIIPAAAAEGIRNSIRKAGAGQSDRGGTRKVEVTLNLTGTLGYDVRLLAREVKAVLEDDIQMSMIGSA